MQQSKLLCPKLSNDKRDTGNVAARPVETGDEAELNRVAAACVDDRDRRSRRLGYDCRGGVSSDHRHLTAYQIGCEVGQSVGLILRPAILDRHILALDEGGFTKALAECGQIPCTIDRRRAAEEPDHRHRRLLRPRRERPRHCRATEQRDELASFHVSYDSGLMFAARTTLLHFSVSSAMSLPKSAGEPGSTVPPDSAIRALILGSVRAALVSWLSLSMTPAGVPLGAPRPNQTHWVKRPEGASITSSTRTRNDSGIVRPSALAV